MWFFIGLLAGFSLLVIFSALYVSRDDDDPRF